MATRELDIPRTLPVEHLSASAISTYLQCPIKWKRRYIDREYEPPSGAIVLGSAVHSAEAHAYESVIHDGERLALPDVLDEFSTAFDQEAERDDIDWGADVPGEIKDKGIEVVTCYEREVAPAVVPVAVERQIDVRLDGVDWTYECHLDLETSDGAVADLKVKKRKLSPADAAVDIQPTSYLLARRAEGNPAPRFDYHTLVKTKTPYAEIVPTERTDAQLDHFIDRLYGIAAEIHWRLETGIWGGAVPGSWFCSQSWCGYWDSCPMGGLR